VIVLAQLPVTRALAGSRRMATLSLLGLVWAVAWLLVPLGGTVLSGTAAAALFAFAAAVFAVGECLHGAVQAPLVADLADHRLIGRYMAASAFSWGVGFTVGPAIGGFVLSVWPHGLWLGAAAVCGLAGLAALVVERGIPAHARRTPGRVAPAEA
jgi:MFS family permease